MAVLRHRVHFLALLLLACLPLIYPARATADTCHYTEQAIITNGTVHIQTVLTCVPTATSGTTEQVALPPRNSNLDAICVSEAISNDVDPFAFCDIPPQDQPTEITPGMIAAELRVVPLPPSVLEVQPPNGRTLVNFETNFFTDTQDFDRSVTLLGQRVDLHIVPAEFGWRFGDGGLLTTDEPGSPYPQLDVTHRYLKKGHVGPSVDTTYTATYRVNGGAWRDVPGSVTIPGAPVDLDVVTATPTLVGYDS
jgi:hypothetical protein